MGDVVIELGEVHEMIVEVPEVGIIVDNEDIDPPK